jgi:hypothetical protein
MNIPPLATTLATEELTPDNMRHLVNAWDTAAQEYRHQAGNRPVSEETLVIAALYLIRGIHQTNTVAAYEGILDGTGPAAPAAHYLLSQPENIFNTCAMIGAAWPQPLQDRMAELYHTVQTARAAHVAQQQGSRT